MIVCKYYAYVNSVRRWQETSR